jgi:tetratricopeptide (TPR) repeat protein
MGDRTRPWRALGIAALAVAAWLGLTSIASDAPSAGGGPASGAAGPEEAGPVSAPAPAGPTGEALAWWNEAESLARSGEFAEAAALLERVAEAAPGWGPGWRRLGVCYRRLGEVDREIATHRRAAEAGPEPDAALYSLAGALARAGRADAAMEALRAAARAGFADASRLDLDPDLEPLRSRDGYADAAREIGANEARLPERRFDFWVGVWDVFDPSGTRVGENVVRALHGGRVIEENWAGASGVGGMSMNFVDPRTGRWRQVWIDAMGGLVEYEGAFEDGAMRMEGFRVDRAGSRVISRASLTPREDGTVRQLIEESADGGATWRVYFDGVYVRRGASDG